jgi:hypothetical protein
MTSQKWGLWNTECFPVALAVQVLQSEAAIVGPAFRYLCDTTPPRLSVR